jgi:hypothetical protein
MKTQNTFNTVGYYLLGIACLILTAIFVVMAGSAATQIINL